MERGRGGDPKSSHGKEANNEPKERERVVSKTDCPRTSVNTKESLVLDRGRKKKVMGAGGGSKKASTTEDLKDGW